MDNPTLEELNAADAHLSDYADAYVARLNVEYASSVVHAPTYAAMVSARKALAATLESEERTEGRIFPAGRPNIHD